MADRASDIRQRTVLTLEEMGIPVEHAQHEDAPSQHEIDLRYTDALTMADTVMTVRLVVKEMARQQGVHASFMPKPLAGVQGSGMHTHLSLFEGDTNAFVDSDRPHGLSEVAERFIAGLLRHASEITAVTNQWVNSYKRLVVGLRGPHPRVLGPQQPLGPGPGAGGQAGEVRVDPGRVPVARQRLQPVPGLRRHPGRRPAGDRGGLRAPARGRRQPLRPDAPRSWPPRASSTFPASLNEALGEMESSELVADTLGDHVFEWFIRNKRAEWAGYKAHVSQFELDRYLPLL